MNTVAVPQQYKCILCLTKTKEQRRVEALASKHHNKRIENREHTKYKKDYLEYIIYI